MEPPLKRWRTIRSLNSPILCCKCCELVVSAYKQTLEPCISSNIIKQEITFKDFKVSKTTFWKFLWLYWKFFFVCPWTFTRVPTGKDPGSIWHPSFQEPPHFPGSAWTANPGTIQENHTPCFVPYRIRAHTFWQKAKLLSWSLAYKNPPWWASTMGRTDLVGEMHGGFSKLRGLSYPNND